MSHLSGAKPHARASSPCAECGGEIVGKVLNALGQQFHPKCFSCSQCSKAPVEEAHKSFFVRAGKVWCGKCRAWARAEKGQMGASDVEHAIDVQQLFQASSAPWAQSMQPTVKCIACQQPINGPIVQIDRAKYHAACIQCQKCNVALPNGHVKVAGQPYCTGCATAAKEARGVKTGYIQGSTISYAGGDAAGSSGAVAAGIRVTREVTTGPSVVRPPPPSAPVAAAPARPAAPAAAPAPAKPTPVNSSSSAAPSCGKCGAPRPATGNAFGGRMAFCQGCGARF